MQVSTIYCSDWSKWHDSWVSHINYWVNKFVKIPKEKGAAWGDLESVNRKQLIINWNWNWFLQTFVDILNFHISVLALGCALAKSPCWKRYMTFNMNKDITIKEEHGYFTFTNLYNWNGNISTFQVHLRPSKSVKKQLRYGTTSMAPNQKSII